MKTRNAFLPALAIASAMALSACEFGSVASSNTSTTTAPQTTPPSAAQAAPSGSKSSAASTSGSSASDSSATPVPSSQRSDAGDKNALDASISKIPSGPMTKLSVVRLGGYAKKHTDEYGQFYAVLKVDGTEGGLVYLEYVVEDDQGKELTRIDDNISVGKGTDMYKITTVPGKVPHGAKKVRLVVKENKPNQFAQDNAVRNVSWRMDEKLDLPVVTGQYKTAPGTTNTSINAVCFDAAGTPRAHSGPTDDIRAEDWSDFKVRLWDADENYKPTMCYAGTS